MASMQSIVMQYLQSITENHKHYVQANQRQLLNNPAQ